MFIRPEHVIGWEYFAARNGGVMVEKYAQAQLDRLGESYVAEREQCIRTGLLLLVELMLQLPEEDRLALEKQVVTRAAERGLIPAARLDVLQGDRSTSEQ